MDRSNIKVKAYAVFRRGQEILVNQVRDENGLLVGFRIPGGHVEFGERAVDTIQREIMEELKTEIVNCNFLSVLENTFVYHAKPGHEVIFCYAADFKDNSFYERETIEAFEDNGMPFTLFWLDPEKRPEETSIFPSGLIDLL